MADDDEAVAGYVRLTMTLPCLLVVVASVSLLRFRLGQPTICSSTGSEVVEMWWMWAFRDVTLVLVPSGAVLHRLASISMLLLLLRLCTVCVVVRVKVMWLLLPWQLMSVACSGSGFSIEAVVLRSWLLTLVRASSRMLIVTAI